MTLRTSSGEEVTFIGERSNHLSNVISVATARTMVRKGCEAYLEYVMDTKKEESSLLDMSHPRPPPGRIKGGAKLY